MYTVKNETFFFFGGGHLRHLRYPVVPEVPYGLEQRIFQHLTQQSQLSERIIANIYLCIFLPSHAPIDDFLVKI